MLNSKIFNKLIEEKKAKCANIHVGMIIKKKRKEMNLTLEEATKGICCVSYLSKLEHGIIEPKRYVMEEVLDRLEVSKTALRAVTDYEKMLNDCLTDLYYEENERITKIYDSIYEEEDIHFTDVIKAIYNYSNGSFEKAEFFLQKAFDVKEHLNDIEIICIVLVSSLIRFKSNDYFEALNQALALTLYTANINANKLKLKIIIQSKFIIGEYSSVLYYINLYSNLCSQTADFEGIKFAKYYSCMTLAISKEENDSMQILEDIKKSLTDDELNYWIKNIYFSSKKYVDAMDFDLNDIEKLWCYEKMGDKDNVIKILENIKIEELKEVEHKIYESIYKKYFLDEQIYFSYIREVLYPYYISHGFYELASDMKEVLEEKYLANNKYKDANRVLHLFNDMHNYRFKK